MLQRYTFGGWRGVQDEQDNRVLRKGIEQIWFYASTQQVFSEYAISKRAKMR
ncbi:MAG: hypothetical protein N3A01_02385 [Bacteroidales bacterium]|nr:hypothetical protein [Bacteroidales bacterium]